MPESAADSAPVQHQRVRSSYPDFAPPPIEAVRAAEVIEVAAVCAPIPGLRAVAYQNRQPLSFIVDTRGMSLESRGMQRPTTSGLDITRERFLAGLTAFAQHAPEQGVWILVTNASLAPNCRPA